MNEQLIKDLEEVMESNRNARRASNDILSRVRNALLKADSDSKKVYERGCEDVWEFCRKLELAENKGGFNLDMQKEVFGDHCDYLIQNIVLNYKTYKEALAKVEAYEQKKKEEAEQNRIIIGDIVVNEHWNIPFIVTEFKNGFIKGIDDNGEPHKFVWPNNLIHKVGSGAGIFDRFKMDELKEE